MKTTMKEERMIKYHHVKKLFARANSKVCFSAQKILFVLKNQLAPALTTGDYGCLQRRLPV
jgi:hypothetical protein